MKPYYEHAGMTIYHGDCLELVYDLPHGLMVTDPPYNVGYHYDEHDDSMPEAAYWEFLGGVLRMPLVFLHYPEALFNVARLFHRVPEKVVAWVYHANTPRQWRALGWFGVAPDFSLDGQDYKNPDDKRVRQLIEAGRKARLYDWWHVEQVKNVSAEKTDHPCQIPVSLMMRALRVTPYDGPIVDPFSGSGTTLLAAKRLEYCEIAASRLSQQSLDLAPDVATEAQQSSLLEAS